MSDLCFIALQWILCQLVALIILQKIYLNPCDFKWIHRKIFILIFNAIINAYVSQIIYLTATFNFVLILFYSFIKISI